MLAAAEKLQLATQEMASIAGSLAAGANLRIFSKVVSLLVYY